MSGSARAWWTVAVVAMALAACGGGSDDAATDTTGAAAGATDVSAPPSEQAADSITAPTAAPTTASPDDESSTIDGAATSAPPTTIEPTFPVTIEHAYGQTTIDEEPLRVVTLGVGEHDYALSLGVTPVGLRTYYFGQPFSVWPWARDELGSAEPALLAPGDVNFEQVAALQPDVIMAMASAIEADEYELLSNIAPTIARPPGTTYQSGNWRDVLQTTGMALGRPNEAAAVERDLDERFAQVREQHPEFVDASVTVAYFNGLDAIGTYPTDDVVFQFIEELGLEPLPSIDSIEPDTIRAISVSPEQLDVLDADVIFWLLGDGPALGQLRDLPTREASLRAAAERREIVSDQVLFSAMFNTSPLSAEFIIDRLVPELADALDGDTSTFASSAAPLYGEENGYVPTAAEQAAMDAWQRALASDVPLDEKRPHIADFEALLPVIEESLAAGAAAGGVSITPIRASIIGDTASVAFEATIGGGSTPGLLGEVELVDGVWVAPRQQLCTYVAFIGVECPPE